MTTPLAKRFDSEGYYRALAATVKQRRVTWKDVSRLTGVSTTTLARMAQGRQPDAQGLAALAAWSALNPADYVRLEDKPAQPDTLAISSTALRADPALPNEAADAIDVMVQSAYDRFRK
jgi:transcriptional regulator with XRE-family HTH domain